MHRTSAKLLLAFTAVFVIVACKEKTAPEPPNAFTAVVTGAVNDTISGVGTFGTHFHMDFIRLTGDDGAMLILQNQTGMRWTLGTHAISDGGAAEILLATEGVTFRGTSGSVTITSTTTRAVVGTFTATLAGSSVGSEGQQVTSSGSFRAKCSFLPDRTCTNPQ